MKARDLAKAKEVRDLLFAEHLNGVMKVKCPKCSAGPGFACFTPKAEPIAGYRWGGQPVSHSARFKALRRKQWQKQPELSALRTFAAAWGWSVEQAIAEVQRRQENP